MSYLVPAAQVSDSEIKAQRWLPPGERAKLEAAKQAEAEALARMQQVSSLAPLTGL